MNHFNYMMNRIVQYSPPFVTMAASKLFQKAVVQARCGIVRAAGYLMNPVHDMLVRRVASIWLLLLTFNDLPNHLPVDV